MMMITTLVVDVRGQRGNRKGLNGSEVSGDETG